MRHTLGGIDTKTVDAERDEVVRMSHDLGAYRSTFGVQTGNESERVDTIPTYYFDVLCEVD